MAPRLPHPTNHPESLHTKQLLIIRRKARNRPRRTTLPLRTPSHTRHPPTRHHHSSLQIHTVTHHNSTARQASHHHPLTNTKEDTKAIQAPHNIRNTVSTDKYQVLRRASLLHISTDTRKDRLVNMASRNMAEDMGSNNRQRMADSKVDTLHTSLRHRASMPLSRHTAKDLQCHMGVILVMEAVRNTKVKLSFGSHPSAYKGTPFRLDSLPRPKSSTPGPIFTGIYLKFTYIFTSCFKCRRCHAVSWSASRRCAIRDSIASADVSYAVPIIPLPD